jgi:hypothetical protein
MGYFTVTKEFSNEDKGQKTKYQVSDVKIGKLPLSRRRVAFSSPAKSLVKNQRD